MTKPRLLDLFCGAGGAARGYQRAGFHVTGVDIRPQPRYAGDHFCQADIMEVGLDVLLRELGPFDAVHASPPCQAYSAMNRFLKRDYPRLVEPVREVLRATGRPYVIENVEGAPLIESLLLCGTMFGLPLRKHRLFEVSVPISPFRSPCACRNGVRSGVLITVRHGGHYVGGPRRGREPRYHGVVARRAAHGIEWMTREELSEAIPPAYTEWIGRQLMAHLQCHQRKGS